MKIGINNFCKRQTKESEFSYYDGAWSEVAQHALDNFGRGEPSESKDGVWLVPVPADGYYSGVIQATKSSAMTADLYRRRPDEEAYIRTRIAGEKMPATHVVLVLYSKETLIADYERDCKAADHAGNPRPELTAYVTNMENDYEVISINGSVGAETPPTPIAMARDFLEKTGGTKADYTAEEFAESIWFWRDKAMRI